MRRGRAAGLAAAGLRAARALGFAPGPVDGVEVRQP